jgi:glycosyltransferase involved in cell wall biosynthesis
MQFQSASTMLDASVIICTHNPRSDYFARVLDGLRNQTLPLHKWELLIVDNASQVPLASSCDVSWHPTARHILERELGVAYARRRGIQESSADLIIFVDDDNVLDENYLAEAIKIGQEWPSLGAWGSGCIRGDFEVEPRESLRSWLPVREVTAPRWSNLAGIHLLGESPEEAIPWGAGLCVRKELAIAYCRFCDQSSLQMITRCEDTEIAFVCCSRGLGVGIFPELKITHLIPQRRVSEDYIVHFAEGIGISNTLLRYKWQHIIPQSPYTIKTLLSVLKTILLYRGVDRDIRFALVRGLIKAKKIIEMDLQKNNGQIYEHGSTPGATTLARSGSAACMLPEDILSQSAKTSGWPASLQQPSIAPQISRLSLDCCAPRRR